MKTIYTRTMELCGDSYEAGYSLGRHFALIPALRSKMTSGFPGFGSPDLKEALACFGRWCPGLTEELAGLADALDCAPEQILYYGMTWLHPRCSHLALLPSMTASGHPMTARNYEFNDEAEDFMAIKANIAGKYAHIGTSVLGIGRDDGINENGLAVTMSSCGFPVGALSQMRPPAVTGLQFWAVIRTLLENCGDVADALSMIRDMPIAYNLNLILLDKGGHGALVETLDGRTAIRTIDPGSKDQYLYAANHPVLEELIPLEPKAMAHSIKRYDTIRTFLKKQESGITADQLKELFLTPYPAGLSCPYYSQYFGTTKSMIMDPVDGTLSLCWGGRQENGWMELSFKDAFPQEIRPVTIEDQEASPSMFTFRSLT